MPSLTAGLTEAKRGKEYTSMKNAEAMHNMVERCKTRLPHHPGGSDHSAHPAIKLSGLCQPSLIHRLQGSKYSPHSSVHYQVKNETADKSERVLGHALSKHGIQRDGNFMVAAVNRWAELPSRQHTLGATVIYVCIRAFVFN